ncbi:Survival factor 1 [Wickerhamomyces ciferrii]|uniref:Survival factor 1 n=1 Tax=Wickerhamomyces ciferrii (strain ATCC 14091 / BCRC 22168 / CBS 111 / JCM 3599 / NBRC 0793 / NRRL Y-1031 F-60-10) TaxID=1206466 RepID=K0KFB0_WICCF|nr:Survival factor 1 [Wickerhamomyces ciferrii]CCH43795.1 Survival factor 1 [Wickerhamomyces ciferrii]
MLKWVQGGLSAVTGIAEPEYGPEYIHSITDTVKDKQHFQIATKQDFKWQSPTSTNVETQTFYFNDLTTGIIGFAQVIHSNVVGIHTTAQFTFKLFNTNTKEQIWTSTKLEDFIIKGENFYASNLKIEINDEGNEYHLVSKVNPESIVDLKFSKIAPSVKIGKDGVTIYGDDVENPWGTMRHVFWPRNKVEGSIQSTKEGSTETKNYEINGFSMFVMALQGMKPHHAAATWNFLNFHSKSLSTVVMEFTTPKSYGSTKVSLAFLSNDEGIIGSSINNEVLHLNPEIDEVGWPKPTSLEFKGHGIDSKANDEQVQSGSAKPVEWTLKGGLQLVERVDVMHEIPNFVKNLVSGVAGTKPYIYQFWDNMTIEYNEIKETSIGYLEATFITEL